MSGVLMWRIHAEVAGRRCSSNSARLILYAEAYLGRAAGRSSGGVCHRPPARPMRFHSSSSSSSSSFGKKRGPTFSSSASSSSGSGAPSLWGSLREALHAFLLKPRTVPVPRWISPRHFSVTLSECCGHASFLLVAVSYAVDDYLWLRTIAVAGSASMLLFTYFHPHGRVLWLPLQWNVLFIATNLYRIGSTLLESYMATASLTDDMCRLRDTHFYLFDLVDFAKLVRVGVVQTYRPGDLVLGQGQMNRYISLVLDGELHVLRDGKITYSVEKGNFISEAGLHAGLKLRGRIESCASIVASKEGAGGKIRLLRWDRTELMDLLDREKGVRQALKAALSWDIVRKLKLQREMLHSGQVDDPGEWTLLRKMQNDRRYASILQNLLHDPSKVYDCRDQLRMYRVIHHIDDDQHERALAMCGWTPQEFEAGIKEGGAAQQEEDDDDDEEDPGDYRAHGIWHTIQRTVGRFLPRIW